MQCDILEMVGVMSVNNETFQALLNGDTLGELRFFSEGQAIDAVKSRLVTYWLDDSVSQGNIFNLFYNDQEELLKFVSYEDIVKETVCSFAGYQESGAVVNLEFQN